MVKLWALDSRQAGFMVFSIWTTAVSGLSTLVAMSYWIHLLTSIRGRPSSVAIVLALAWWRASVILWRLVAGRHCLAIARVWVIPLMLWLFLQGTLRFSSSRSAPLS